MQSSHLTIWGAGMSRRTALRAGPLVGAGLAGVATGMFSSPKPANAEGAAQSTGCGTPSGRACSIRETARPDDVPLAADMVPTIVNYWLWHEAEGTGNGRIGWCPAGRRHDRTGSLNYGVYHDHPPVGGQPDWAWRQCPPAAVVMTRPWAGLLRACSSGRGEVFR